MDKTEADIRAYLEDDLVRTHVAIAESFVVGFVGTRIHPEDQMGEVFIIAVDPTHQRKGIADGSWKYLFIMLKRPE